MAALALGHALHVSYGFLDPTALAALGVALVACMLGILLPTPGPFRHREAYLTLGLLAAGLVFQLFWLAGPPPGIYLRLSGPEDLSIFRFGVGVAGAVALSGLLARPPLRRLHLPLLVALHFALGVWVLRASPEPPIDVFVIYQQGAEELAAGRNPYGMTIPDLYEPTEPRYGPGLAEDGEVAIGFPYPPLSLLLALPGHVVAGDYRYAMLVAFSASGALLGSLRPGRIGLAVAAVFLFTPRGFFVLEQGWNEPFLLALLMALAAASLRGSRALPVALGLLLTAKQYMVLAVPLSWLLVRPPRALHARRLVVGAILAAGVVILPFLLWDAQTLIRDLLLVVVAGHPFRPESLSFSAMIWHLWGYQLPTWSSFVAAGATGLLVLWRCPRSAAGFAAGTAAIFLVFFALGKQAFANYYFFVVGCLCCALASAPMDESASGPTGGR